MNEKTLVSIRLFQTIAVQAGCPMGFHVKLVKVSRLYALAEIKTAANAGETEELRLHSGPKVPNLLDIQQLGLVQ